MIHTGNMVTHSTAPSGSDPGDLKELPVKKLTINSLVISNSPRRSGRNASHVRALAEHEGHLPPILVHYPSMRVLDGVHRVEAAKLRGAEDIEAYIFDGDEPASFVLAVRANVAHGLPLSLADRKAAAARIIDSYPVWSDRMIASMSGLSHKTVAAIRARLTGEVTPLDARVGRDGRVRPRNTAERREIIAALINDHPTASLREIARKSNASPETVRRVRASMVHDNQDTMPELAHPEFRPAGGSIPARAAVVDRVRSLGSASADRKSSLDALRADPALRSAQSGRLLLRLLSAQKIIRDQGQWLIQSIPPHCLTWLALAARECAREWNDLAEQAEASAREAMAFKKSRASSTRVS
jgi:ParB-like chromosome segregation protein Spo0J